MVGQVEVLDRELALVAELVEAARAPSAKSTTPLASSTCTCVWPGLPCRSWMWSAYSSTSSGSPPQSATWPVSMRNRRPGTSSLIALMRLERVHASRRPTARAGSPGASRNLRTVHSHMPSPRGRRGRRAPARLRLRERRRAADRQRERRGIDLDASRRCARSRARGPAPRRDRRGRARTRRRRPRAGTCPTRRPSEPWCSMPVGMTMPTCWRCWPSIWSKCSATSSGVQPPSRHIHAICFGCWNSVNA